MTTEDLILQAAIACIETYGIEKITIRKIAEEAGVNSAAISYYFRGKDTLIRKAMEISLRNAFTMEDFSASDNADPRGRLVHVFSTLMEGALRFPGITKAHFHGIILGDGMDTPASQHINRFFRELEADLLERGLEMPPLELHHRIIHMAASLLIYPGLMPGLLIPYSSLDLSDREVREHHIGILIDSLFQQM